MHNPSTFSQTWQEIFQEQLPPEILERYAQIYKEKSQKKHRDRGEALRTGQRFDLLFLDGGIDVLRCVDDLGKIDLLAIAIKSNLSVWRVREHVRCFIGWRYIQMKEEEALVDWPRVLKVKC